ncbi:MAG: SAV_6107 family HEPN domain-containing protein [Actinomycetia bacterium]|nr:SAV_6107 family HEPN domain-containing protein [Actinomycetes bacterium]
MSVTTVETPPYADDLRRAREALEQADRCQSPDERFLASYLAAMRVAVTVLAVRARPRPRQGPADLWQVLARAAPEYVEWAAFFATLRPRREAIRAGATAVAGEREADDLRRDAQAFHDQVERQLGRAWQRALARRGRHD